MTNDDELSFEVFFESAELNPKAVLAKGVICSYRIEVIETPLTRQEVEFKAHQRIEFAL